MHKHIYTLFLVTLVWITHNYPSIGAPRPNAQAKKFVSFIRMPHSFQADFVYTHIQGGTKPEDTPEEYQIEGKIWVKGNKYRLVLADQIVVSNGVTIWNYVPSL